MDELPKIDLNTFFLSISSAACFSLGVQPPGSKEIPQFDLRLAKQNIDLLELMEEKTKGNRNQGEDQLLEQLLFEVRMRFVEAEKENASKNEP